MTGEISVATLDPVPITDGDQILRDGFNIDDIEFRLVREPDSWLQAAYDLLSTEFDRSVLDPLERFVEWLDMNNRNEHPFPFLMMVAYVREGTFARVIGVISGNIMKIQNYTKSPDRRIQNRFMFAIGNQITASQLRSRKIKGVGTRLLGTAVDEARKWIEAMGGDFEFSLLEAENESVGFWIKAGFLWPRDVRYWQPPLEFGRDGKCIQPEVPEILMIKPTVRRAKPEIDAALLKNAIATLYLNWSLAKYRKVLGHKAMAAAERYVMKDLFGEVCRRMPEEKAVKLIRLNVKSRRTDRHHFRSMALNRGTEHHLRPLRSPRLDDIDSFNDMLKAMGDMAFGARTLGEAADVLTEMASDKKCKVVLTLSGAVTVAKFDLIIAEMIERGLVHCIISTGAIITHGFNSEKGGTHFMVPANATDTWLYENGFNRIYDSIETEYTLDELEDIIRNILDDHPEERPLCSSDIVRLMGKYIGRSKARHGLLQTAYRKNVPIFIPSFTDSEIGLDFALYNYNRRKLKQKELKYDPYIDFKRYASFIRESETLGILTLGGGVPRNWAQQIGPYFDAIERRENAIAVRATRFKYAVRICPDPDYWGGLSGSTYSEGISWGKFMSPDEGGMTAEILSDYTFVFPFLIKGLFERLDSRKKPRRRR